MGDVGDGIETPYFIEKIYNPSLSFASSPPPSFPQKRCPYSRSPAIFLNPSPKISLAFATMVNAFLSISFTASSSFAA